MCENLCLDKSNIPMENGDNTTFGDSLWKCMKNPREARVILRRRFEDNKHFLPCGTKKAGTALPNQKRSLGIDIQPIKSKRSSVKDVQLSKKPRLDATAAPIDQTLLLNDFNPPIASTPAPQINPKHPESNRIGNPSEINCNPSDRDSNPKDRNSNLSDKNSNLESIREVEEVVVPKTPQASKIPVLESPVRTPKRRSSVNPVALRAILQNANRTPLKKNEEGNTVRTPPKNLEELDERLRTFNVNNSRKRLENNVDDASEAQKSISVIEILDSTTEENGEQSKILNIPETPYPKPASNVSIPDEHITIPETQRLDFPSPEESQAIIADEHCPKDVVTEECSQQAPEECSQQFPEECSQQVPEECSQQVLDLRLRRSQSVPKAIDLRLNTTRKSRRLSESSVRQSSENSKRKSSRRANLSQSLKVSSFSRNKSIVLNGKQDIGSEPTLRIDEASIIRKDTVPENEECVENIDTEAEAPGPPKVSVRRPGESVAPKVDLCVILEENSAGEDPREGVVELQQEPGDGRITPIIPRTSTSLTEPQILEKINEDIMEMLPIREPDIIKPPKGFHDSPDASELLNESITGSLSRNGQFQKVVLRNSAEFPAPIERQDKDKEDYLKTVKDAQRNAKRRKKRARTKRPLYNKHDDSDMEMESNTESILVKRRSPEKLVKMVRENMTRTSDAPKDSRSVNVNCRRSRLTRAAMKSKEDVRPPSVEFARPFDVASPPEHRQGYSQFSKRMSKARRSITFEEKLDVPSCNNEKSIQNQNPIPENPIPEHADRAEDTEDALKTTKIDTTIPVAKRTRQSLTLVTTAVETININSYRLADERPNTPQKTTNKPSKRISMEDKPPEKELDTERSPSRMESVRRNKQSIGCSPMHGSHLNLAEEPDPEPAINKPKPAPQKKKKAKEKPPIPTDKAEKDETNEKIRQRPCRNRKPPGAFWCHGPNDYLAQPTYHPDIIPKTSKTKKAKTKKKDKNDFKNQTNSHPSPIKKVKKRVGISVTEIPSPPPKAQKTEHKINKETTKIPSKSKEKSNKQENRNIQDNPKPGPSGIKEKEPSTVQNDKNDEVPEKQKKKKGKKKTVKASIEVNDNKKTDSEDIENPTSVVVSSAVPEPTKKKGRSTKNMSLDKRKANTQTAETTTKNFEFAVPVPPKKVNQPKVSEVHSTPNINSNISARMLNFSKQMDLNAVFDQLASLSSIENTTKSSEGPASSSKTSEASSNLGNGSNWIEKLKRQKLDADPEAQATIRDDVMCIEHLTFEKDKNGVEYAYYKGGENQRIGYIRLQPTIIKKRCKSKHYTLDFLIMNGSVTISVEEADKKKFRICKEGDLCSVPKNSKYEIRNESKDDIAMIMIVKPMV